MERPIDVICVPFILTLLLLAGPARAQRMPEAFLGLAPSTPSSACGTSQAQKNDFGAKIRELEAAIDKESKRRTQERKAHEQELRRKIGNNLARRAGMTPGEAQTAQAGGAAGEAAADSAMRRQTGMSMDELRALKGKSKEERKAWALAHAGQIGVNAPSNPPSPRQVNRVTELQRQIAEVAGTLAKKKEQLEKRTADLDASARQLMGALQTDAERREFCERYSPQLRAIVSDYLDFTHGAIPECYRLEQMEAEAAKLSTGVDPQIEPGGAGLSAVRSYLHALSGAFRYDLVER